MHKKLQQELARDLRKSQTPSEKILWRHLRRKAIDGHRFLRQVIIRYLVESSREGFFIVDFLCPESMLVIEDDGSVHDQKLDHDRAREDILIRLGYKVVRFSNDEIFSDPFGVIDKIKTAL
jgi:very-short-patch-repair endonuclease